MHHTVEIHTDVVPNTHTANVTGSHHKPIVTSFHIHKHHTIQVSSSHGPYFVISTRMVSQGHKASITRSYHQSIMTSCHIHKNHTIQVSRSHDPYFVKSTRMVSQVQRHTAISQVHNDQLSDSQKPLDPGLHNFEIHTDAFTRRPHELTPHSCHAKKCTNPKDMFWNTLRHVVGKVNPFNPNVCSNETFFEKYWN